MIKKIRFIPLVAISIMSTFVSTYALGETPVVKVNGKAMTFPDAQPYVNEDNRTMVPVRFITEALGCEVEWEEQSERVTISKPPKKIILKIGDNWAMVNSSGVDERKEFDTKATLKEERTFVPLRFVSETLGAIVDWEEKTNSVIITEGTLSTPVPTPVVEIVETPAPTPEPIVDPVTEVTPVPSPTATPSVEKKEIPIQVLNGMTMEFAEQDPLLSQLIKLEGFTSVRYSGQNKNLITVGYNEFHSDGRMDRAMEIEYTLDMKNYFFTVYRDSEETHKRIRESLEILIADSEELQQEVYTVIVNQKTQDSSTGYKIDENYGIVANKISTTWRYDDKPWGVWCKLYRRQ